MTKRLFLIISALIISLGFCTYGSEFWIDNVNYEIIDSTERLVAVKGCKDKDNGLYIPEKVEYNGVEFSVVEIITHWSYEYEISNYVVIPGSITKIDVSFNGELSGIKEIIFLDGESKLTLGSTGGTFCLGSSQLETVYFGRTVYRGDADYLFGTLLGYEGNLKKVILGQHCNYLPDRCFSGQSELNEFYICGGPIEVKYQDFDEIFYDVPTTCNFYIP